MNITIQDVQCKCCSCLFICNHFCFTYCLDLNQKQSHFVVSFLHFAPQPNDNLIISLFNRNNHRKFVRIRPNASEEMKKEGNNNLRRLWFYHVWYLSMGGTSCNYSFALDGKFQTHLRLSLKSATRRNKSHSSYFVSRIFAYLLPFFLLSHRIYTLQLYNHF